MNVNRCIPVLAAIGVTSFCLASATAQDLAASYRGMLVCDQLGGSLDILHAPLDLAIHGTEVQFARPLFDLQGTTVIGSELGSGNVDSDGKLHLSSSWVFHGVAVKGEYSGTLTSTGGTFTGAQTRRGHGGMTGSRTCAAAFVPVPVPKTEATSDD